MKADLVYILMCAIFSFRNLVLSFLIKTTMKKVKKIKRRPKKQCLFTT